MQIFFNILTVLATIISPMLVAYFVYDKWHDQKGNEVIANEAKESYKELLSNIFETSILINHISIDNITSIDIDKFLQLRDSSNDLLKKLLLIDSVILIENFHTDINNFERNNREILNSLFDLIYENKLDIIASRIVLETLKSREKSNNNYSEKLIKQLQPYILYRKDITFKL